MVKLPETQVTFWVAEVIQRREHCVLNDWTTKPVHEAIV